jgi:hypothetical protein
LKYNCCDKLLKTNIKQGIINKNKELKMSYEIGDITLSTHPRPLSASKEG